MTKENITKVEAIAEIMSRLDNAPLIWPTIYSYIERHYPRFTTAKDWKAGIRGVLYREMRNRRTFKRVGERAFALRANRK
jgi:hypothetical protein